jgi:predicted molibdopterin-dependent oxidoreductase YjgC
VPRLADEGRAVVRITHHPILGDQPEAGEVTITVDGAPLKAREGEMIAAALTAAGIKRLRTTSKTHEPRGVFCAIGRCTDCVMVVNGRPNVRTCVTPVQEGMVVSSQEGLGVWGGGSRS